MARIIKNQEKWHALTIKGDRSGDVVLVSGGPRHSYLSATPGRGDYSISISGQVTLRSLAYAILREVGFNRRPKKRRAQRSEANG